MNSEVVRKMDESDDIRDVPYIVIEERWTRYSGERKVNGKWEPIDLSLYGGRPPFYIVEWFEREKEFPKTTFGSLKPQ